MEKEKKDKKQKREKTEPKNEGKKGKITAYTNGMYISSLRSTLHERI